MAICGTYTIESNGTLKDFFVQLKKNLDTYSGWTAVEDECSDLQLTYTDDMIGGTVTITDSKITDDNYGTTYNNFLFILLSVEGKNYKLNANTTCYSSNTYVGSTEATRKITLSVCTTNTFEHVEFLPYNISVASWNAYGVGYTESIRISDGSSVRRFHYGSAYVDYTHTFANSSTRQNALTYSVTDGGIVMQKMILGDSNSYLEVLNDVYACSTVTAGLKYLIGDKHYYAISSNILIPLD